MTILEPLVPAALQQDGDTPTSTVFGDVYFSRDNGLHESRHVFLQGNRLHERWQALPQNASFVIGETGFGTGLNFLLAWQLWLEAAPDDAHLTFISTELYPLTHTDLAQALAHWPALKTFSDALLQQYPPLVPGFHTLHFSDKSVTLLLLFGDAQRTLPQLADTLHSQFAAQLPWYVDAWFLDGFSPAKNPQLWQQSLLAHIAALSNTDTTLATFTAAGQVRRDLIAHGFAVKKIPGYGSKREMIVASKLAETGAQNTTTQNTVAETPWLLHIRPTPAQSTLAQSTPAQSIPAAPQQVVVIGAGLAGCHIARALAERGLHVTVLDQHAQPAQEASGNPQGALYTKLSNSNSALSQFSLASLQFALRHYQQPVFAEAVSTCGLLQLQDNLDKNLQALLAHSPQLAQWLDAETASHISGIDVTRGGWFLPQAGWIDPQRLCKILLDHPRITTQYSRHIASWQRENDHWLTYDQQNQCITSSRDLVIACANQTQQFLQTQWLPLRPVRGQITQLASTATSSTLRCVICDEGYLTPAQPRQQQQQHCLGASFIPDDTSTALRDREQQHNLALLSAIAPALQQDWHSAPLSGRAALRCTTPDHLPLVGALPNREIFLQHYAALKHNARQTIPTAGEYVEGLWLLTGFGGRGLCYIPLAAELLTAQILGRPRPLPRHVCQALAPARFVIRELIRTHAHR